MSFLNITLSTLFTHLMFWIAMGIAAYNAFTDDYACATFFLVLALFIEITNLIECIKRSQDERNHLLKSLTDLTQKWDHNSNKDN